jgi:FtsP/CotA-like multicopper oxidase with cupredoxin domain
VTIINELGDDIQTMHWHGIDQRHTCFNDGSVTLTQCPINTKIPGTNTLVSPLSKITSMTYLFQPTREGTYWYHGHYNEQYVDGQYGPLIVQDSAKTTNALKKLGAGYDEELVVSVADWYDKAPHSLVPDYLSPASGGDEPLPDAIIVNGQLSNSLVFNVKRSKKYRLRLINAAGFSMYTLSVDGLPLRVIELDGSYITPVDLASVTVNAAQRSSVILDFSRLSATMKKSPVITFRLSATPDMYPQYNSSDPVAQGLYGTSSGQPFVTEWVGQFTFSKGSATYDTTHPPPSLYPVPADTNLLQSTPLFPEPVPARDLLINYLIEFYADADGVNRAHVNGQSFTGLDAANPYLHQYLQPGGGPLKELSSYPKGTVIQGDANHPFVIPYNRVIDVFFNNTDGGEHPIHVHGHNFWIIGTSDYNNPGINVKRDVVSVPAYGWALIRFVSDNPGTWFIHCHIDWHMAAGFIATIIEAPSKIRSYQNPLPQDHKDACKYVPTKKPTVSPTAKPTKQPK